MTDNTERDSLARAISASVGGWNQATQAIQNTADAVLAWMRENGYEKREEGSCWDERPAVTRHGECPGMPDLCELPAGHRGAHRSGRVEWLTRKREPVVVDDAMVKRAMRGYNAAYRANVHAPGTHLFRAAMLAALTSDGQEANRG